MEYVDVNLEKEICPIFYKCRIYAFQVCGQGSSDRLLMVQKAENKALRIMVFMDERNPCEPLFPEAKIPIKPKI